MVGLNTLRILHNFIVISASGITMFCSRRLRTLFQHIFNDILHGMHAVKKNQERVDGRKQLTCIHATPSDKLQIQNLSSLELAMKYGLKETTSMRILNAA